MRLFGKIYTNKNVKQTDKVVQQPKTLIKPKRKCCGK